MAKNESKSLAVVAQSAGLQPSDIANLQKFVQSGFLEEKSFWVGNPEDGKVGIYFGEILGEGEPILLEQMGGKPDANGVIPTNEVPCFLCHPLDPTTFLPLEARTDNVIANAAVASACKRYLKLARDKGARAQVLMRWEGMGKTRKGNPFNQISTMFRLVDDKGAVVEAGSSAPKENG